jgi:predicted HicB family RNase H-like nuclease
MKAEKKRTTVYLDPQLHRALRIKAAETGHSMSELVQYAIKISLRKMPRTLPPMKNAGMNPD